MTHPPIQIVDENDRPVRGGTMDEVQLNGLWHRISRVAVFAEGSNKLLLQKRSANSFYFALCWDLSATGHVDEGETYKTAGLREMNEELGLEVQDIEEVDYYQSTNAINERTFNRFNKTFKLTVDDAVQLKPDPEEVADLQWFTKEEVLHMMQAEPDTMTDGLKTFIQHNLL